MKVFSYLSLTASDLGFFEFTKPTEKFEATPKGEKDIVFEYGSLGSKDDQKENTPLRQKSHNVFSPASFLASNVNFTTNGTPYSNLKPNTSQSPMADQTKTSEHKIDSSGFASMKDLFQTQEYIDNYDDEPLSLVWSNEPLKTVKQKLNISPDNFPPNNKKAEYGVEYFPKPFDAEDSYNYEFLGYENSQDNSKSENDFSKFFIKREEGVGGLPSLNPLSHANRTSSARTPVSEKTYSKKNTWEAPSRSNIFFCYCVMSLEISDSFQDDDDKFDPNSDKARSSRGLRVLSLKVKDIVSEKKRTSYKEVAECLIDELGQKMPGKLQGEVNNYESCVINSIVKRRTKC